MAPLEFDQLISLASKTHLFGIVQLILPVDHGVNGFDFIRFGMTRTFDAGRSKGRLSVHQIHGRLVDGNRVLGCENPYVGDYWRIGKRIAVASRGNLSQEINA